MTIIRRKTVHFTLRQAPEHLNNLSDYLCHAQQLRRTVAQRTIHERVTLCCSPCTTMASDWFETGAFERFLQRHLKVFHALSPSSAYNELEMWQLWMHCNSRPPDVAPIVLGCFWPILYCACAHTAISQLPIKLMASPLDSATQIS